MTKFHSRAPSKTVLAIVPPIAAWTTVFTSPVLRP
jgi:hypothetical protein